MEYITKDQGSYQLHIIKTNAFKTITVKIYLKEIAKKENITKRNFLNDILLLSNEDYKTKSSFNKALQNLYAANINIATRRLGSYLDTCFTLRVLNDKYTEKGNFEQAIAFFTSVLLRPNATDGAFDEKNFQTVYEDYQADLNSLKDDRRLYAIIRLLEETNKKQALASTYRSVGYQEDLQKITKQNLYQYYLEMLKHNLIDIYVLGDVDEVEVQNLFRQYFQINTYKLRKQPILLKEIPTTRSKTITECLPSNQSQLCMSLSTNNLTDYERNYPLSIYNTILGGGTDSMLFKEVREENSLAYYIGSSPSKFDRLILINGGITNSSSKEVTRLIKKQLKKLTKGSFTEENIQAAKEFYLSALDDIKESANRLIESYYMMDLLGVDDIETKREKIQKVTKEEVIAVANKVKINTIFVLEGEDNATN